MFLKGWGEVFVSKSIADGEREESGEKNEEKYEEGDEEEDEEADVEVSFQFIRLKGN